MAAFTSFLQSRECFDMWSKEQPLDNTETDLDEPPWGVLDVLMDPSPHASPR